MDEQETVKVEEKVFDVAVKTNNPEYAVRRLVDRRSRLLKLARTPRRNLDSVIKKADSLGMEDTVARLREILSEVIAIEAEVERLGYEMLIVESTGSVSWRKKLDQFDE